MYAPAQLLEANNLRRQSQHKTHFNDFGSETLLLEAIEIADYRPDCEAKRLSTEFTNIFPEQCGENLFNSAEYLNMNIQFRYDFVCELNIHIQLV
jgi:hypothetical protein